MEKQFFKLLFSLLFATIIFSCNQTGSKTTENAESADGQLETDISGIYQYHHDGDTVELQLEVDTAQVGANQVNGNLVFALKEKDRNTGSIQGQINDGLLIADYNFMSEGMMSIRQVAFKIENNTARMMNGDMEEKAGKFVYKQPDSLEADSQMVLIKK